LRNQGHASPGKQHDPAASTTRPVMEPATGLRIPDSGMGPCAPTRQPATCSCPDPLLWPGPPLHYDQPLLLTHPIRQSSISCTLHERRSFWDFPPPIRCHYVLEAEATSQKPCTTHLAAGQRGIACLTWRRRASWGCVFQYFVSSIQVQTEAGVPFWEG
jgi:hypothetical protein